jgi:hypothetical protein
MIEADVTDQLCKRMKQSNGQQRSDEAVISNNLIGQLSMFITKMILLGRSSK